MDEFKNLKKYLTNVHEKTNKKLEIWDLSLFFILSFLSNTF